ncbi:hypothetical protein [Longispora albida]|uniref:hypothetical protein n=1 Tax=Longispora albida TaxID=203523 RepID=UPI0012FA6BAD|nr:hypothetical protein [Longispora albida]
MEVLIEAVLEQHDRVAFQCAYGSAWAHWRGESTPEVGIREVELEFPSGVLRWTESAGPEVSRTKIRQEGELLVLAGLVERIADDGVIDFRFGPDIILLDSVPQAENLSAGMSVEFWFDELELYPYVI